MNHPVMGAEDFSYVLEQVPGAMAFLGACPAGADPATTPDNHSNRVVFDEDSMASGVAVYAALALRHLADAG
jgi:hippurate hydrolase